MSAIIINNKKYTLVDDVIKNAPIYCKGVRSSRDFIKRKEIESKYYIFARCIDNVWTVNEGKSPKYDRVLIRNVCLLKLDAYVKEINNENVISEDGIMGAPEIVDLEDEEKFTDENGNMLEIETRGSRECDNIYFKVKDVGKEFDMKKLQDTIINSAGSYKTIKHYKYFMCNIPIKNGIKTGKKQQVTKELFLTYEGMLRVLFVSNNDKTNKFVKWATEKLFTIQMGTQVQKTELVSKILGTNVNNVIEVFNTHANSIPVTYFFTLGTVKDLRKSMSINDTYNDDQIVSIYGYTKDIVRRTKEHNKYYKQFKGVDLKLKYQSYVDPQYLSNAEKEISDYVDDLDCRFEFKSEKEIIIINSKQMKRFESQYESISKKYMGHIADLVNQLREEQYKNKLLVEQHKNEIQKYDNMLLKKDLEIMKLTYNN
jgi:hypothetical protein